jgi:hypothetical protein
MSDGLTYFFIFCSNFNYRVAAPSLRRTPLMLHLVISDSLIWLIDLFIVLNATFSNISAIPCRPVLVVEEAGVPGENHRPWASNW